MHKACNSLQQMYPQSFVWIYSTMFCQRPEPALIIIPSRQTSLKALLTTAHSSMPSRIRNFKRPVA